MHQYENVPWLHGADGVARAVSMSAKSPVQIPAAAAAYPMSANMPAQTIA